MNISGTVGVISGINECIDLFQWFRSAISSLRSQWNATQKQKLHEDDVLLQLQSDVRRLEETLPAMYNLIDRAEWSHLPCVAELLPKLKDAVYDAEDILDEFRWYEQKVSVEGNATTQLSPFIEFFGSVIHGSFNKVTDIQGRLNSISSWLEKMGVYQTTPRFDKSVRPETTSFPTEPKIFGREEELQELIRLLGVYEDNVRPNSKRKRTDIPAVSSSSNHVSTMLDSNEGTIARVPILPIVGIGGVGKTTLAQNISSHPQVKSHFNLIIWICVSDDFDLKRLTKEAIQASSSRATTTDNLDSLQLALGNSVNKRRFLLILDDMWDDALRESSQCWNRFCAPFTNVLQGSMMLVTTRSQNVANLLGTMDPFPLFGLKDHVFWDFFNLCIFGHEYSNPDPELIQIGRRILPKLKGSPLAAKTIGRLLALSLDTSHWDTVLKSELWELKQEETDILPALRLSYIYLPFHLKRCFAFCAVYPKDHQFEKLNLAEIWVAEGFVEPQGAIAHQVIGCQYFDELADRSFFQMVRRKYVIHDLMHDMTQLVSKDECFIIKNTCDFEKVPQNVRHLSILTNRNIKCSNLLSLCKHSKLRTLLCNKSLMDKASESVMDNWCSKLRCMRVIFLASTRVLPDSIGNMKHLRYLEIIGVCPLKSIPSALCSLYHLRNLYARKCKFETLPNEFSKLINLQGFESHGLRCPVEHQLLVTASPGELQGKEITLLKNINQFSSLSIHNLQAVSKHHAAAANLKNKEYLNSLTLEWSWRTSPDPNDIELFEALCPPTNLKSLTLRDYPGQYFPSWFYPQQLPSITSLVISGLNGLKGMPEFGIFSSLTHFFIGRCEQLSSLEGFLQPACLPGIKKIEIENCINLVTLPTARFAEFVCLDEMNVSRCPHIYSPHLVAPSLKKLIVGETGNLAHNIECCSLTELSFSNSLLMPIQLLNWSSSLPALQKLAIISGESNHSKLCGNLRIRPFSSLTDLSIIECKKLESLDDILSHDYLPAIESIRVQYCQQLQYPSGEKFGSLEFLKHLYIHHCPHLIWHGRTMLPSSLQRLGLHSCGNISGWFPSGLEHQYLNSLKSLGLVSCGHVVSIPGHMWSLNLPSLQELCVVSCPDLVSIGGPNAVANIDKVFIGGCVSLMTELPEQPVRRGKFRGKWSTEFKFLV